MPITPSNKRRLVGPPTSGLLTLILALCAAPVSGQDSATWVNGTGVWSNPANWSCVIGGVSQSCVPNANNINVGILNGEDHQNNEKDDDTDDFGVHLFSLL